LYRRLIPCLIGLGVARLGERQGKKVWYGFTVRLGEQHGEKLSYVFR
jgi:hypothetical protein